LDKEAVEELNFQEELLDHLGFQVVAQELQVHWD
jgi:hypothetical protein